MYSGHYYLLNMSKFILLCLCSFALNGLIAQSNYLNQGNKALKDSLYVEAEALYAKAEEYCSEASKARNNRAVLSAMNGDLKEADKNLEKLIAAKSGNPTYYYNRSLIALANKDYNLALNMLSKCEELGQKSTGKAERAANQLKRKTEVTKAQLLMALSEEATEAKNYKAAHKYIDEVRKLVEDEKYLLFEKMKLGQLEKNPFVILENAEAIHTATLSQNEQLELLIAKAHSLGRINRIKEAVKLLEDFIYYQSSEDPRPRNFLSYYYLKLGDYSKSVNVLKGQIYNDANVYVIAGNAALYQKKYALALRCFDKAKYLDKESLNADIGRAFCYSSKAQHSKATQLVDSLAQAYPDNYYVWNTRGIVYKDVGLYHKNRYNNSRAQKYFVTSAQSFLAAQKANQNLRTSFDSNRALALFFMDNKKEAHTIWSSIDVMASHNNLALYHASKKDYRAAYNKLDSLLKSYKAVHKKNQQVVAYNRDLARDRTRLNNNYKFVTCYFLTQEKPELEITNPFLPPSINSPDAQALDYILEYSDEDCSEKVERKKIKKKRKFRLFKRKNKKYNGDCPSF